MKALFPILLITMLFGCKQPAKQYIFDNKPWLPPLTVYATTNGDKIVFLDNFYTAYLNASRVSTGIKNKNNFYMQFVCEYFTEKKYWRDLETWFLSVTAPDTARLAEYAYTLKVKQEEIFELITCALTDADKNLKNDSITIYIKPSNIESNRYNMKHIEINIDTAITNWKQKIKFCIAWKFYNAYCMGKRINYCNNLLADIIETGRAASFAHLVCPDIKYPWTKEIIVNDERHLWRKIKPDLQWVDYMRRHEIMQGSNSTDIDALGYHIVQSALKHHPELTPEQWTNLAPEKILEMSDYK